MLTVFLLLTTGCQKDDSLYCWVEIEGDFELLAIDKAPEFINGGDSGFNVALLEETMYPVEARENGIEGRAVLQYEITMTGEVMNIIIIEDPGGGLGAEVVRTLEVVTEGIAFYPAELNGMAITVRKELPVIFSLP